MCLALFQDLAGWSSIYLRYLQVFRKLDTAHMNIIQPQKRKDLRTALEACMGRMLEVRTYMVRLSPYISI